jgi:predicted tellurium resistance membrane protein TerC
MPEFLAWMATPQGWASLATLTLLEVVLGIDNVIFISIAASRLPRAQQATARRIGLFLALFLRIALLSVLVWLAQLNQPLFDRARQRSVLARHHPDRRVAFI